MSEDHTRRRRERRPATASTPFTLIGPGGVVRGELLLTGDVVIHGRLEGTLFTDGEVRVEADGSVEGGIHGRVVVVEGTCRGRLEALRAVVLRAGSVVHAEIDAPVFEVAYGARFTGRHLPSASGAAPSLRVRNYRNASPGNA